MPVPTCRTPAVHLPADFSKPNVDYADLLRLSQNATKPAIARVGGVCMARWHGIVMHDRHGGRRRSRLSSACPR